MIRLSSRALENLGITASLDKKNSPSSERWYRYVRGVVTSSSKGAPLGNGLLQRSWWYLRSVGLRASGSLPGDVSDLESKVMSIASPRPISRRYTPERDSGVRAHQIPPAAA